MTDYAEMVTVQVGVFRRFYDFAKAYVEFFGKETTVEDFMREAIYDSIRTVYTQLEGIERESVSIPTGINKGDWLGRFSNISFITAPADDET